MTGHILIVDALTTNRIILKAKLSAAFYVVQQADTGREAIAAAARNNPDLLVISGALPDMETSELMHAIDRVCAAPRPPVIVTLTEDTPSARLSAFEAGATYVIAHPFDDAMLLARVRALLRQRQQDCDLTQHANATDAFGFAEEPPEFSGAGRVSVLARDESTAKSICRRLDPFCQHELAAFSYTRPDTSEHLTPTPDVIALHIGTTAEMAGLRSMAELQAATATRHARFVAILDDAVAHLTAPVLDMGASDVMRSRTGNRELATRLQAQVSGKKHTDVLRGRLENGLQAALIDPLTGLHNRRYAHFFLRNMIDQAQRNGHTFAVMLADLDHFKVVNDAFGHRTGDAVLARVAAEMQKVLPTDAMIARVGGEEFLVAIPDTSLSEVRLLADRLGRTVRENPVVLTDGGGPVQVTISIGATLASPRSGASEQSADALIEMADRALYESKSGGRDTATVSARSAA